MKNAILPSFSSQVYCSEKNETVYEGARLTYNNFNMHGNSFNFDPRLLYPDHPDQLEGGFSISYSQPSVNHFQPGPPSVFKRLDGGCPFLGADYSPATSANSMVQQPPSLSSKPSVPQSAKSQINLKSSRKRRTETSDLNPKKGSPGLMNKRERAAMRCHEGRLEPTVQQVIEGVQSERVAVRRSQKLSDRITALQKLVSPYGKTDTASVLDEASICIKILQDQIQKLFHVLSNSYINSKTPDLKEEKEAAEHTLSSRGLCLVPTSSACSETF